MGPPLRILGTDYATPDGTAIRDYVHVIDLADAHIRALDHLADGGPSTTLNLGTGVGTSVREVVDAVAREIGEAVPVTESGRRAGDPAAVWADAERAREALGWTAQLWVPEIVASAVRCHPSHPDGYPR